jgi:hypothetical protein
MKLSALVFKNIHRHRKSFGFAIVGILLGVTSFVVFLSLGQGLRKNVLERVYVVDQLEVVPRRYEMGAFQGTGTLFSDRTGLDDFTVDDLRDLPGVAAVYPKMQISFPGIISGGQELLGRNFWTELIADGVPAELIAAELPEPEDPLYVFRDWDGDEFTCEQPGAEGRGPAVGCPPGRACDDAGQCVRLDCNPPDEVLATSSRAFVQLAGRFVRARLGMGRQRPEVRILEDEDLVPGSGPRFRLVLNERHLENARAVLGDLVAPREAMTRVHLGLDRTRNEMMAEPPSLSRVRRVESIVLFGHEFACDDPPSYCPVDTRHCEMPIPIVASHFLLELYNTSIQTILTGSDRSMPQISPETILGIVLHVSLGRGVLGEAVNVDEVGISKRRLRLVGWSPRAMRLGATMPLGYVRRLNMRYVSEDAVDQYHGILVVAESSEDLGRIALQVQDDLGFAIGPEYDQAKRGSLMITLLTVGLLLISGLIILLAALNIMHTFMMLVAERRREIGVLRAVGARRMHIASLMLAEAAIIGLTGAVLACLMALGVAEAADYAVNRYVPDFPFKPDSLFAFESWIFGAGVAVALLFSVIGAFFPAYRASRMDPAEALRAP